MDIHCDVPGCITLLGRLSPEVREDGRRYCFVHDTMADACEGVVESFQWLKPGKHPQERDVVQEFTVFGGKVCCECKRRLPASADYFRRDRHQTDGLTHSCKSCRKKRDDKTYDERREQRLEVSRARHRKNRDRMSEYEHERRVRDGDRIRARQRAWYAANRDAVNERRRAYEAQKRGAL
jgi:hypothetical protein